MTFSKTLKPCESSYLRPHPGVPPDVVIHPQLQMVQAGNRIQDVVFIVHIEGIGEFL